ncbi:hypothetical protein SAMN04489858_12084 [Paracoccus homiensis]|uniref:Uncharacterized protein n=1 Tax=Paracoccus homiensis TaxID=364199 RepID=A0A1I0J1Y9_9RHOB|nr:hypothetical protein SAMN04489858_12084 [Paracoccus homiensis]
MTRPTDAEVREMTTVRALEIVLSRLKMDDETARIMKYHLNSERRAALARYRGGVTSPSDPGS